MDMGHNKLSQKLDQIRREELGIHFDNSILWEDLSTKLGNSKAVLIDRRLLIAACVTLLILLFPIVFINDSAPVQLASEVSSDEFVNEGAEKLGNPVVAIPETNEKIAKTTLHFVARKEIEFNTVALIDYSMDDLKLLPIVKNKKIKKQLFADQDISIIQANLGKSRIEKEKSVRMSAQLHTSSQSVQLNNQELKIKLFERSNQ